MTKDGYGKRLFLIFPFFNEEPNLTTFLAEIEKFSVSHPEYKVRILAVDDGSIDGGGDILRGQSGKLSIELIENGCNLGPGRSFAAAFSRLSGRLEPGDLVATMEADNTSGLEILSRMLVRIREGYDSVLASPYTYGGGFPEVSIFRVIISHSANSLVKIFFKLRGINTFSCFFRLYRGDAIRRLQKEFGEGVIESPGFECMVELLYKMVLLRFAISEVEFKVDWSRRRGKSKMKILRTIKGYLRTILARSRWKRLGTPESLKSHT